MNAAPRLHPPVLDDDSFREFQRLTLEVTGIALADSKRAMVTTRFARRLRALGLPDFESYLALVRQPNDPERAAYVDTITTNLSYFFREPHHFEMLTTRVLPALDERAPASRPLRLWSAGCSHGQEPLSIAIAALESPVGERRTLRILCTDIHSAALRQTAAGIYRGEELRGLSAERRDRWFERRADGSFRACDALGRLLVCRPMNLFGPWPIRSGVDVIFCRNVMIYFDEDHRRRLVEGFAAMQSSGASLFLGHSEVLHDRDDLYRRVDSTLYERR